MDHSNRSGIRGLLEGMGCFGRLFFFLVCIVIFITGVGECEESQRKRRMLERERTRSREPIPPLGVEEPKMPTRFLKSTKRNDEYLRKDDFYEGLEDAEMKGEADDPSVQDIYDEFR